MLVGTKPILYRLPTALCFWQVLDLDWYESLYTSGIAKNMWYFCFHNACYDLGESNYTLLLLCRYDDNFILYFYFVL